jgi:hypothetical protein
LGQAALRGKAAEGRRSPGRWREFWRRTHGAKRLGVRQPSGALKIPLVAGAFGVTVSAAMKTLSAKAKISGLAVCEMILRLRCLKSQRDGGN